MQNTYKNIFLFFTIIIVMTSCFDDPGTKIVFSGQLVEIESATLQGDSSTKDTRLYEIALDNQPTKDSIKFNWVGAQLNQPVTITVEIIPNAGPEDSLGTTAIEGVEYANFETTVTIPANSSFGFLKFDVLDDNLTDDPDDQVGIKFRIVSTSLGQISRNYGTHRVVIGGKCSFNPDTFTGTTYATSLTLAGALVGTVSTQNSELIRGSGPNDIIVTDWIRTGFPLTLVFDPVSETVSVPAQTINLGAVGVPANFVVTGSSSPINTCTGSFEVRFTLTNGASVATGTQTFTKQ